MATFVDLKGKRFGRLFVLHREGTRNGFAAWRCRCACGGEWVGGSRHLRNGNTTRCPACNLKSRTRDLHSRSAEVVAFYESGHSLDETATNFGTSVSAIRNLFRRNGVKPRTNNETRRMGWNEERSAKWSKARMGERGGKTGLNRGIRSMKVYKDWRTAVFSRDNWTCQRCGARGVELNADHTTKFSDLLVTHNIKCTEDAFNCAALWDTSIGVTLCVDCHKQTPTYGRRRPRHSRS